MICRDDRELRWQLLMSYRTYLYCYTFLRHFNYLCYLISIIVLANILDPLDMITVSNKKFQVNIESGLPKIYYPKSSIVYNTPHIWAPVNLVRGRSVSSSSDSSKNPQLQGY